MCFGLILSHEQVNLCHYRCTTVFHIVIFNSKIKKLTVELKIKIRGNGNSINTSSVNAKTSLQVPI